MSHARSVVGAGEAAVRGEQFELTTAGHQMFGTVQELDDMAMITGDAGQSDHGPPMQLVMINFGRTDLEPSAQLGYQGSYDGPFLLQRMHITEQQVELDPPDPHPSMITHGAKRDRPRQRCEPDRVGCRRFRSEP